MNKEKLGAQHCAQALYHMVKGSKDALQVSKFGFRGR